MDLTNPNMALVPIPNNMAELEAIIEELTRLTMARMTPEQQASMAEQAAVRMSDVLAEKVLPAEQARLAEALGAWPKEGQPPRDYVVTSDYKAPPRFCPPRRWVRKESTRIIEVGSARKRTIDSAKAKPGDIVLFTERCNCGTCSGYQALFVGDSEILELEFSGLDAMRWHCEGVELLELVPLAVKHADVRGS